MISTRAVSLNCASRKIHLIIFCGSYLVPPPFSSATHSPVLPFLFHEAIATHLLLLLLFKGLCFHLSFHFLFQSSFRREVVRRRSRGRSSFLLHSSLAFTFALAVYVPERNLIYISIYLSIYSSFLS